MHEIYRVMFVFVVRFH